MDVLAPMFAVIFSIGGPVSIAIVAIVISFKDRRKRYEVMLKALELGKDPEAVKQMFMGSKKKLDNGLGYMKGGILVSGVGVGLAGMGLILNQYEIYAPALFLLILGLAMLVVHFITKPKSAKK